MEQELDRNDAATPYKLEQARRKGQVARSADVVSAIVFGVAVVYFYARGWAFVSAQFQFDGQLFRLAAAVDHPAQLWDLIAQSCRAALALLLPFFATIMIAAILANVLQTGPVLSAHPIQPDWQRLNPATGLKRILSIRTLFDAGRAIIKLTVLVLVVHAALTALLPQFPQLAGRPPLAFARMLIDDVASLCLKLALALAVIALIDLGFSRREFAKNMRMSKRELKDEVKNREGDPRIRGRLRELRREMLRRSRSLSKTGSADVLITNPTHFAVALRYQHGEMAAPQLLAKGAGGMAAAMRQIASAKRIPVVQNRTLARAIYFNMDIDQQVPPTLYADVARIVVWVLAMRRAREMGASA
ncbi:flagellar biosynthetic protein FlhB [Roseateles sp. YR242]|uniref:EscU/YscU/HrcU family type III secretion system export apparatus switch protein n=1 Tax=Roseateles sp. YR242 TaxID=1855305 RepID=UPI0008CEB8FC|nr:EscU/YscU/HrcU family type III secretion system export apparatus switch protein [Roseateles sp. YR242]SEK93390.1 flagellar biosynthetic protein FlhB [Roseateles sp. YR242]